MLKQKSVFKIFIISVSFLFCQSIFATTFTIGAIYPPDTEISHGIYVIDNVIKREKIKNLNIKLIKLINNDNSVSTAIQLAKIAKTLHLDAVICGGNSDQSLVIANILNEAKIPLFIAVGVHPDISKNKPYVVTTLPNAENTCELFVKYISQVVKNPKKALIVINSSSQYTTYHAITIAKLLKEKYNSIAINFINIINGYECTECMAKAAAQLKPDIIYFPLTSEQNSSFLIDLTKTNFPTNVFMNGRYSVVDEVKYYHTILKKSPAISPHVFTVWNGHLSGKFSSEYKNITHGKNESDLKTAMTFDTIKLLITTLKNHPLAKGMDLVVYAKSKSFSGITGTFWFDKQGNNRKDNKNAFYVM
jgi:ABC-type branched-subunit amino acid transport system substrate-binding protein